MSLRAEVADHSLRSRLVKPPRGLRYLMLYVTRNTNLMGKYFEPPGTLNFEYASYFLEALKQPGFLVSLVLANSERSL